MREAMLAANEQSKNMSKESKSNLSFSNYGWAILCIVFGVSCFYGGKFSSYPFSAKTEHWGQIGDFFGGIINPVIGIFNLYVFWRLTQKLISLEENSQKRQEDFFYNQLRINAYSDFSDKSYGIMNGPEISDINTKFHKLSTYLTWFRMKHKHLFDSLKQKDWDLGLKTTLKEAQLLNVSDPTSDKSIKVAGLAGKKLIEFAMKLESELTSNSKNTR